MSMLRVHVRPAGVRTRQPGKRAQAAARHLLRGNKMIERTKDKQVPCQSCAISALERLAPVSGVTGHP